ncbi:hypothetical protein OBBRIDRAFT_887424 [Obba rivulosa]|uniref:Uncharacterized protein n=1 Tax=Obba rivulosa TaxID=1052685 RepID=A0A8E2AZ07_9APHY|nr:hypothetical protein OBBRIDRAFT_887424 [Obba rivulosa]
MTQRQRKKLAELSSVHDIDLSFLSLPEPADGERGVTKAEASTLIGMLVDKQLSAARRYLVSIGQQPVESGVPRAFRTGRPTSAQRAMLLAAQTRGVSVPDLVLSNAALAYFAIRSLLSDGTFEGRKYGQQPLQSDGAHQDSDAKDPRWRRSQRSERRR